MNQINRIQSYIESVNKTQEHSIKLDINSLGKETDKEYENVGIIIKILMYLGGLLSSLFFCVFIFIALEIQNPYIIICFGFALLITGVVVNRRARKLIEDLFSFYAFMLGQVLISYGLLEIDIHSEYVVILIFMILNLITLPFLKRYFLHFLCYSALVSSFLRLIVASDIDSLFYLYQIIIILGITVLCLYEDRCIAFLRKKNDKYTPLRDVLLITYLLCFSNFMNIDFLFSLKYNWLISSVVLVCFIFSIYKVSREHKATSKMLLFLAPVLLFSILTINAPYIIGSFYLLFLGIYINHKTIKGLAILGIVYSISFFYYDLELTLLIKSLILMTSGVVILFIYWGIFYKKLIK